MPVLSKYLLPIFLGAALILSAQSAVFAGDNPPDLNTMPVLPQPDANTPPKVALKEISDTCKHFTKAVSGIMNELQRREQVEYVNPWFGDPGFADPYNSFGMMYPIADDTMFSFREDGPRLPPRKKWLDFYNGEIDQLSTMLTNEISVTKMPAGTSAVVDWQVASDTMKTVDQDRQTLRTLCAADTVNVDAVMKQAQILRDDVSGIDRITKRLSSSIDHLAKQ
jgi:hypothetical protein